MVKIIPKSDIEDERLFQINAVVDLSDIVDSHEALRKQLEDAVEVIKFYADDSAWEHSAEYSDGDDFLKIADSDEIKKKDSKDCIGGRRARQFLESMEGKK